MFVGPNPASHQLHPSATEALLPPREGPCPALPCPHPSQAQGTKGTFYQGVERQGAPTGLVFGLHHHHHVKAIAGEVFALQEEEGEEVEEDCLIDR